MSSTTWNFAPPPNSRYLTLEETWTLAAQEYLQRADDYRIIHGNEQYARGCERKALKKFEKSYQMRHWADGR